MRVNLWDILLGLAVAAALILAVRKSLKLRKKGGCCGSGGCGDCKLCGKGKA